MRRIILLIILLVFLLISSGFTFFKKVSVPVNGVYSLKKKTLTYFDLVSKDINLHANLAELIDSKPDDLDIEISDFDKLIDPEFGSFRLGNNNKKIWFLMGRDSKGFWSELYIDQNLDYTIDSKERLKTFQTIETQDQGFKIAEATSLIPILLKVSYKGLTKEFEQNLYFFILTAVYTKNKTSETIVKAVNASFFDGQMKVKIGKDEKLVKYRILDFDANGCYNDYNNDLIYTDLNNDGFFTKNEGQTLQEYFSFTDSNKGKKQLHMILLPFPAKFAVTDDSQDFNLSELESTEVEPQTNSEENSENVNTDEKSAESDNESTDTN
jgi:hypothetical protein